MLPNTLKQLQSRHIILASQSPRRKELLAGLGIDFEVRVLPNLEESFPETLQPHEVPAFLARQKADAYRAQLRPNNILITADTIVATETDILGKPTDAAEAYKMIKALCKTNHKVITGVHICNTTKEVSLTSITKVYFSDLTDEEINYYIETYKPYDKAGSYGIQEWIGFIGIERIEGSYFNVMGLPVHCLYDALKTF